MKKKILFTGGSSFLVQNWINYIDEKKIIYLFFYKNKINFRKKNSNILIP